MAFVWDYMVMKCQFLGIFPHLVSTEHEAQEAYEGRYANSSSSLTKLL